VEIHLDPSNLPLRLGKLQTVSQKNPVTELEQQPIHHLLVIEDKQGKRTIALEASTCSLGRDPSNSIVLNSNLISRQHAILLRLTTPETSRILFRLIDGNLQGKRSTNGFTVNGKRCSAHDLKHGDVIVFGGDVRARYYASVNPSDVELLTSCEAEDLSGFLSNLVNPFETIVSVDAGLDNSSEGALARLASFPELITNPILEINLAGRITYLNPAAISQFPRIQAIKLQHPVLAGLLDTVKRSKEKFFTREVAVNQQVFEQSVHYIAESELVRTYLVNITARKQAEAALRQSQQKLSLHMQQTPLAVIEWSPDFRVIDWNPAAESLFGYPKSEVVGRYAAELLIPESARELVNQIWNQLLTQKAGTCSTNENLTKDGRTIICEWYNTPLIDYSGDVIGVTSLAQDITERQQAEVALQSAHSKLEVKVAERTAELLQSNEQLRREIGERQRAEEEVRLLQTMTQAISESSDFHSALGVALQQVCEVTGWSYGEAWIPDPSSGTLKCSPAWYGAGSQKDYLQGSNPSLAKLASGEQSILERFRSLSEGLTFPPTISLPGRVWSSRQPEWTQDVSYGADTMSLRTQVAIEAGFKAGLGIPIINYATQDEAEGILAVLIFFIVQSCEEDKRLVELVSTVATQLGSLIQRKRAEEALRESEERFRLLVEGVKDHAIFMLDPEGYVASWNAGAERNKGYRAEEIIGKHFSCFYPETDKARGKPAQELRVAATAGQVESEGWRVRKDGSRFWGNVVITALHSNPPPAAPAGTLGELRGFSQVTRDITDRKRAEIKLRESQRTLATLFSNLPGMAYRCQQGSSGWTMKFVSEGSLQLTGYRPCELIENSITSYEQLTHPADRETIRNDIEEALRQQRPFQLIYRIVTAAGEEKWVWEKGLGVHSPEGEVIAIEGFVSDITERKQAEEALQRSFATNRALLNAIPDLMVRISKDGILVNFKAPNDNSLLVAPNEYLNKNLYEVLPPDVARLAMDSVQRALETGEVQVLEYQLPVNNNLHDYEARIVVSAANEVMAIVRDITERKRAEADIRSALAKEKELGELKSRFVTMASHEFRTPLTTILSSTELLEHYGHKWGEEKKAVHLHRIQAAVRHMTGLLNDVLLIGKAEAGKLEYNPVPLDLRQFCREMVEEMQISNNSHAITWVSQGQCADAVMDEKLLRHILSNLLSNAIKYSPQSGTVYFDLSCHQGEAMFQIRDEGIGIPAADQAKLFDSFHRASNVGTISGTGLGLAIVKKSVDLHGGTITVKSEVGVGTTFTVSLPLTKQVIDQ